MSGTLFFLTKSKCHQFECFRGPQKLISHLHLLGKTFPDFPSGKLKVKITQLCPTLCDLMDCCLWNSADQNTGVGSLSLLQGIVPTQGLNPGLSHCRWILCQLSHKGSPRTLEWVAYPFSSGSSWSRNQTRVSCIAGGFFTLSHQGSPT